MQAYSAAKLSDMKKIWSQKSDAVVIFTGKPVITSFADVMHAFQGIFRVKSKVTARDPRIVALSACNAVVVCTQEVKQERGSSESKMIATNVFELDVDLKEWRVVEHHSSPIMFPNIPRPRNETKMAFGETF